jgi:hypothetical protein
VKEAKVSSDILVDSKETKQELNAEAGNKERMQALQLRCYMSETRSRAFEEALDQHNEAVANNVALTPSKTTKNEQDDEQAIAFSSHE